MENEYGMTQVFATLAGVLYAVLGISELATAAGADIGLPAWLNISGSILGGAMLLVIAAVFFRGLAKAGHDAQAGTAFVKVGIFLALVFAGVFLLVLFGNALMAYAVGSEDYARWAPWDDVVPLVYAALVPLLGRVALGGMVPQRSEGGAR